METLNKADSIVIGAGAGPSTSAGFIYAGKRFEKFFYDFIATYHFWQMTAKNPQATYACINYGESVCPEDIRNRSICLSGDAGYIIQDLL